MDKQSQKLFDELVAKAPHELRPTDVEFLKARISYLTPAQRELFASVLDPKPEPKEEPAPAPKKKDK